MRLLVLSLFAAGLGATAWTLLEYLLYRFIFHSASSPRLGAKDLRRHYSQVVYFAPWWKKSLATLAATALVLPVATAIGGTTIGLSVTAGFIGRYLLYEVLHRRAHTHPPIGTYGRWLRRNHFAHHFVDRRRALGVTTPVWDWVFGTRLPVEKVPVPRRLAMPWLIDAHGAVYPAYLDEYELVGDDGDDDSTGGADDETATANRSPEATTSPPIASIKTPR